MASTKISRNDLISTYMQDTGQWIGRISDSTLGISSTLYLNDTTDNHDMNGYNLDAYLVLEGWSDPPLNHTNYNSDYLPGSVKFKNILINDNAAQWTALGYVNSLDWNISQYGLSVDNSTYPTSVRLNMGNGISKIGVFRNPTHMFYIDYNGNGVWEGAVIDRSYDFGITGDIPVSGDWNNDGRTEIGVFRPSTHLYYQDYNGNGVWNGPVVDRAFNFGITGDIPVSGDWNNDGVSEIGVFRPSTQIYYQDYNGNGVWEGGDRSYNFDITGDSPVSGKWS